MNDEDVPCPDPNEPVTRRILDEVLHARFLEFEKRIGAQIAATIEAAEHRIMRDVTQHINAANEALKSDLLNVFEPAEKRIADTETRLTSVEARTAALEAPRRVSRPRTPTTRRKKRR